MPEANEPARRYRNRMWLMIGALFLGYVAFKTWHITTALDAYQGQAIEGDVSKAAK